MQNVFEILKRKGHTVFSVTPETTVYDALQIMAANDIGALLVMENGSLKGIMSERDYARKVILFGKSSKETFVSEIMSGNVITVNLKHSANDCMQVMSERKIRHLPVVDGEKVVGIISIGDVVKSILEEQQLLINQLEQYITGSTK